MLAKEMTVRESIFQPAFDAPRNWLLSYESRSENILPTAYWKVLSRLKKEYVSKDDQSAAKAAWCMETIGQIQDSFVSAFAPIRERDFKTAWDCFAKCEGSIHSLDRHFNEEYGEFGIEHVRIHTRQFQELFPLKWGISPGILINEKRCSVCNSKLTVRFGCEHQNGEIYDGELCNDVVTEFELLHVALVDKPAQRGTVIWPEIEGNPGFIPLISVVDGLTSPWVRWSCDKEERRIHHPAFKSVGRNDRCPCGSNLKYKRCCLNKQMVPEFPHFKITIQRKALA